jgi:hypothetical protein
MEERMQAHRLAGEIQDYNALVTPHNRMVSDYNQDLDAYREAYSRYEAYVTVYNYIIEHPHDRPGVYNYIRETMPR